MLRTDVTNESGRYWIFTLFSTQQYLSQGKFLWEKISIL